MSKLLTTEQTASRLNVSLHTLRYWIQQGTAPASFKMGRRRMFREEAVEAWLAQRIAESANQ